MTNNPHAHYSVLLKLNALPERMVTAHHYHNLAEYVLHELCDPLCLSLHKAAFLLDNPDFDTLKGVAGVHHQERFTAPSSMPHENEDGSVWQHTDQFTEHMANCRFNKAVRSVQRKSAQRTAMPWSECAAELADEMVFEQDKWGWLTFAAKHGNTGILIFESPDQSNPEREASLACSVSLLGLCPVF
jgi:hypothetical protein